MFQILCITERGARIAGSDGRVAVSKNEPPTDSFVPVDDLDAVVIEENAVSLSGCCLAMLAEKRIPVILCGRSHFPAAVLNPVISAGSDARLMLQSQIDAPLAWKKQLWRKLICAKIAGQSANLVRRGKQNIDQLIALVRSGDPRNIEGRAAALYWSRLDLFPARKRDAPDANRFFNYAYTVLFSAFARYLCAASLNPDIGIHHHGKYNHFSLASDLMEPFRPWIDQCVFSLIDSSPGNVELLPETRIAMLRLIYDCKVWIRSRRFVLFDAVNETVHSFKRSLISRDPAMLILPEVP